MLDTVRTFRTAAVIGSGFGGLAVAIRLQAAGLVTTLYEARDKLGGCASTYEDEGFTFDAGPTALTDPSGLEELFALAGRRLGDTVELIPASPLYRLLWPDGRVFDCCRDPQALDAQIRSFSPRDVEGYHRFLAYAQAALQESYGRHGATAFLYLTDLLKAAPGMLRLRAWRSLYAMVARHVREDHLRQAFSFQALMVGGNPFAIPAPYALIHAMERKWGLAAPRGGMGMLVRALARLFEALGGEIHSGRAVDEIIVAGRRARAVRLKGGETVPCDVVVSNADVVYTYARLLRASPRGRLEGARLAGKRHSPSVFMVHFGTRRRWDHLVRHTVLFAPRYRALIADIFEGPALADDLAIHLHAPTVSDASLAPPGGSTFRALVPVPHLGVARLDWAKLGPAYRDRILAHLEARLLPGLRASIVTARTVSPFDFRDQLRAHHGSAFSLEPRASQCAWFRPHARDDQIVNLYLVGAGTHPGAGVPAVVASAKAAAELILADFAAGRVGPRRRGRGAGGPPRQFPH